MSHGPHTVEVLLYALSLLDPHLIQFPGGESSGANDHIVLADFLREVFDGLFPAHRKIGNHWVFDVVFDEALPPHQEGVGRSARLEVEQGEVQGRRRALLVVRHHLVTDAHVRDEVVHDLALHHVLRLVLVAGLASPADEEQHGDLVHLGVHQTQQRVDRVAQARVLHVHQGKLPGRHVVARRQRHCRALVRCYYVLLRWVVVSHVATEVLQERVRHTREEVEASLCQLLVKYVRRKEITLCLLQGTWLTHLDKTAQWDHPLKYSTKHYMCLISQ